MLPPDVVLWDMPDCDATGSRTYMDAVVEAVTVADVVIYVTSVERYAVAHLLEWVFLLHDAGIDVVECLNKTRRREQERVIAHQRCTHFPELARRLGLRRVPALVVTDLDVSPFVCGLWRQTLVLPCDLLAALDPSQLRQVLLHELAHVRRGDLLWGWLPEMKTAFTKTDNVDFLKYLNDRTRAPLGRRYFLITEAGRATSVRSMLPTQRAKESFEVLDTTSNKFTLVAFYL